ncbi:MAG: hypothetical protein CL711_01365 [Chloroflexi bacterium]|nr:hypothetical protein [Chloroflexota bacterium]
MSNSLSIEKYKLLEKKISGRTTDKRNLEVEDLMVAAVSILIEKDNPDFPIYMIKRANEGKHALEWAFPGGKVEKIDNDLEDTATRETNEEIGVLESDFSLWGELDPVMTLGTGWIIQPFVGEITKNSKININKEEVEELAKIPLFDLLEKQNKRYVSFTKEDERIDSRAYAYEDKLIWGASARMIIQLSELLKD